MQIDTKKRSIFYKALSDPLRLDIIMDLLRSKECKCICDISKVIKRDQSVAFRHIKILENAGIISTHKEKNCLMCCIKNKEKTQKYLED